MKNTRQTTLNAIWLTIWQLRPGCRYRSADRSYQIYWRAEDTS